jgi:hypothetical protein
VLPDTTLQTCIVHLIRNSLAHNIAGKILADKAVEQTAEHMLLEIATIHGAAHVVGNFPYTVL